MKYDTVLVTGGAGYIGSHAVHSLLKSGRNVIVIDRDKESCDDLKRCFPRNKRLKVYCADFDNDMYTENILKNEGVKAVMHFAASTSVPESVQRPIEYYSNNTAKTIRLVERMIRYGVFRLISSSTSAVYGNPEDPNKLITEKTLCRPINPYGQSKLMIESILKNTSNAIPAFEYTSFRYFNVAGNVITNKVRDFKWREKSNVIPKFLKAIREGKNTIDIYGVDYPTKDGTCLRDYIHVEDIISAHMIALEDDIYGVYNLGCSEPSSVWDVVNAVVSVTNSEVDVLHKPKRNGDPVVLIADSTKFRELTGWEPNYNLKEMVATAWKAYTNEK